MAESPELPERELQRIAAMFNRLYPSLDPIDDHHAIRAVIRRAQATLWARDVVSFAAVGITRWVLALIAVFGRLDPHISSRGKTNA